MAAPATIVIAKILKPELEESLTKGEVKLHVEKTATNIIEAAANGAADGCQAGAQCRARCCWPFIALIAMIDYPLGWIGEYHRAGGGSHGQFAQPVDDPGLLALAPLAWVIGVPWQDAVTVGGLIGEKVVTNEFVAYAHLTEIQATLSPKALLISTYALCGFANFSSIAIQLGGIGGIAPERKPDLARLGLRAVMGGTLATMMTATIAGVLTSIA